VAKFISLPLLQHFHLAESSSFSQTAYLDILSTKTEYFPWVEYQLSAT